MTAMLNMEMMVLCGLDLMTSLRLYRAPCWIAAGGGLGSWILGHSDESISIAPFDVIAEYWIDSK